MGCNVQSRLSLVLLFSLVTSLLVLDAASKNEPQALKLRGDVEYTHDPSIAKDGDTWYLFGTANGPVRKGELPIRCSKDLHDWKLCGYVFDKIPEWITKESPKTKELWAPDVSYFNGEYHLYYAFSVFGKNTSGIALLTNTTLNPSRPDYHWVDRGLVLRSRAEDNFNAIDANLVIDSKGQPWLAFGSFWTGIKMRQIDPKTGLLSSSDIQLYSLASRKRPDNPPPNPPGLPGDWQAIEAPFIGSSRGMEIITTYSSRLICVVGAQKATTKPWSAAHAILPDPMSTRTERQCSRAAVLDYCWATVVGWGRGENPCLSSKTETSSSSTLTTPKREKRSFRFQLWLGSMDGRRRRWKAEILRNSARPVRFTLI
jgi:hypothetical protein